MIPQQTDSERGRASRTNASKRAVASSSRPSTSAEANDNRQTKLGPGGGRISTTQRLQPAGYDSKTSSYTRAGATRGVRDETLRSFELLTIGTGKRK